MHHDELYRDRIGVRLVDKHLSEYKQMEKDLKFNKRKNYSAKPHSSQSKTQKGAQCYKCGGTPHAKHECPANDAKCRSCRKKGHY